MTRITPLTRSLVMLAGWASVLAVVSGRVELVLVAVPFVVLLVLGTRRGEPVSYALGHEISPRRLFEGDRLAVSVTLNATSPLAQIEVYEALPVSAELSAGSNRSVWSLGAHETARWSYELRCPGRAEFSLGTLYLRIWDPSGLRVVEARHRDPKAVRVYPLIEPVRRLPRPLRTQTFVGNYVAPTYGEGIEPGEIRPFAPGDQVRHVNWRASLRLGKLYVTRQHEERNADVMLMLDTSSQVGLAPGSSLDHCVRAAASLAWAYLSRKDRVGLIKYGGLLHWVKPGSGRVQFERLLDTLLEAEVVFTYVAKDLALVPPRVLSPRSLVIALSPLLDSRFIKAATDLAARGFDVAILCVSAVDITRACQDGSVLVDVACRLWELKRRDRLADLRRQGLRVLEWHPGEPLDLVLGQLGRHRRLPAVAA
ncbi:MAG TPA: DUF58 domain-containing protein [Methylomirabilota bacterium]|jgi:uncharacterized protein (DUF58 family)|nr:DUF58 domain-containing protein [Methylomirabilota bacterium]